MSEHEHTAASPTGDRARRPADRARSGLGQAMALLRADAAACPQIANSHRLADYLACEGIEL